VNISKNTKRDNSDVHQQALAQRDIVYINI
jgi:hypothetical protein